MKNMDTKEMKECIRQVRSTLECCGNCGRYVAHECVLKGKKKAPGLWCKYWEVNKVTLMIRQSVQANMQSKAVENSLKENLEEV